jgi:hypothetical protein
VKAWATPPAAAIVTAKVAVSRIMVRFMGCSFEGGFEFGGQLGRPPSTGRETSVNALVRSVKVSRGPIAQRSLSGQHRVGFSMYLARETVQSSRIVLWSIGCEQS